MHRRIFPLLAPNVEVGIGHRRTCHLQRYRLNPSVRLLLSHLLLILDPPLLILLPAIAIVRTLPVAALFNPAAITLRPVKLPRLFCTQLSTGYTFLINPTCHCLFRVIARTLASSRISLPQIPAKVYSVIFSVSHIRRFILPRICYIRSRKRASVPLHLTVVSNSWTWLCLLATF